MNIPLLAKNFLSNAIAGFPSHCHLNLGGSQTLTLNRSELRDLVADRILRTREIHAQNDYYGHARILKHFAGLPETETIKAAIEHGPFFGGFVWNEDVNAPLPAIIAFSKSRFPFLKRRTDKKLFAVGPILSYAPHFLSEGGLAAEKVRLGKNLLVFPAHSTHHLDAHFDMAEYCKHLGEISKGFDTVRICLYWKDVLRGWDNDFRDRGFECVTAGHIFDPLFLPRLKSIIECATFTASNELGTHLGYCVMMGKGHHIFAHKVERKAEASIVLRDSPDRSLEPDVVEVKKTFLQWHDTLTPQQEEIVSRYWGVREKQTPEQLREIFGEAEVLYRSKRPGILRLRDHCRWMVRN